MGRLESSSVRCLKIFTLRWSFKFFWLSKWGPLFCSTPPPHSHFCTVHAHFLIMGGLPSSLVRCLKNLSPLPPPPVIPKILTTKRSPNLFVPLTGKMNSIYICLKTYAPHHSIKGEINRPFTLDEIWIHVWYMT